MDNPLLSSERLQLPQRKKVVVIPFRALPIWQSVSPLPLFHYLPLAMFPDSLFAFLAPSYKLSYSGGR